MGIFQDCFQIIQGNIRSAKLQTWGWSSEIREGRRRDKFKGGKSRNEEEEEARKKLIIIMEEEEGVGRCNMVYKTNKNLLIIVQRARKSTKKSEMSEYHKMDTNEYPNIRMPHYVPNDYPNIFGCNIFTERISKYICALDIAQIRIQITFKGHFIQILEYLYSSLIEEFFLKGSLMFLLIRILHWIFLYAEIISRFPFFIKIR